MEKPNVVKKPQEGSFTIFETLVALGILMAVVLEVSATQGNISSFATYSRRATEAIWLAKRMMSQVEYQWHRRDLKEMDFKQAEQPFKIDGMTEEDDYTYTMEIREWKLPIFDMLSGGGLQGQDEEDSDSDDNADPAAGGLAGAEALIDQLFDGHILKTAYIEVFWPEGARRNSVSLVLLLTNQRALDGYLLTKEQKFQQLLAKVKQELSGKKPDDKKKPVKKNQNEDPDNPGVDQGVF